MLIKISPVITLCFYMLLRLLAFHVTAYITARQIKQMESLKFKNLYGIQINHQSDATIFQFTILTFIYSSTCFGRFPAHHQELDDCSGSLWFYLR
jgi:LPS O-antigen subunit length determinant protein (WzzB/FepE family)